MSVTVIIGNSTTDYYLATKIIKKIPAVIIVKYDHVKTKNLKYYFSKLKRIGFFKSFFIKLLSIFLRLEIIVERLTNKSIWTKLKITRPKCPECAEIDVCRTLDELYKLTCNSEVIVLSQTIRLTDKFFRKDRKIIQIIGGKYPQYCGDSSVFWATALQNEADYCFSLIERHRYFQKSTIIRYCPIALSKGDSIRLIRAKGIIEVAEELPQVILNYMVAKVSENTANFELPVTLNTPTLADYIKVVYFKIKFKQIPKYAFSR